MKPSDVHEGFKSFWLSVSPMQLADMSEAWEPPLVCADTVEVWWVASVTPRKSKILIFQKFEHLCKPRSTYMQGFELPLYYPTKGGNFISSTNAVI